MKRTFFRMLAWALTPYAGLAHAMVKRAMKRPYLHLEGYMERYWVFNPYTKEPGPRYIKQFPGLPSSRIHHILRADDDRHTHDHPFNAWTLILAGWYDEELLDANGNTYIVRRDAGYYGPINWGQQHRIIQVSKGGVWTLFTIFKVFGSWGFFIGGHKIASDEYLAIKRHVDQINELYPANKRMGIEAQQQLVEDHFVTKYNINMPNPWPCCGQLRCTCTKE